MKIIVLSFIILVVSVPAFADVYVLFNSSTKEVQDISGNNNAVIEEGFEKAVLPGIITDYPLAENPQNYKFVDKRFVLNIQKINEKVAEQESEKKKAKELALIRAKAEEMAYDALVLEGVVFEKISKDSFTKEAVKE